MDLKPYIRKANYYETDQMGVIHHSNYIRWFEEARVDLMDQIGYGYEKAVEAGVDFAVLNVYCEYKSMVHFADTVQIHVFITSVETMKMTIEYRITDNTTGKLHTVGKTEHCFFDRHKKRPTALKKAAPELYGILISLIKS